MNYISKIKSLRIAPEEESLRKNDSDCISHEVFIEGRKIELLLKSKYDPRRNADPLLFSPKTSRCFCGSNSASGAIQRISEHSNIYYLEKRKKALVYAEKCGPEEE